MNWRERIEVEIVYPLPLEQVVERITVPVGTSVREAIERSKVTLRHPEIDLKRNRVGIHGRIVELDTALQHDDRIEIYRALVVDPKEARRRRAAHKLSQAATRRDRRR